jgi:hypothetical protein
MHCKDLLVAAPIVAYNMFMNGIDRMDQYRSTLATQRKEKRLHMTIFTFLMDLGISQAFAVYQKIADERNESTQHNFFEFKRKVCESLIKELQENPEGRRGRPAAPSSAATTTIVETLGSIEESHMLVQNLPRSKNPKQIQDVDCFLCWKLGKKLKQFILACNARRHFM